MAGANFMGELLIVLNVNNFKQVNDLNGHRAGDCMLIEIAQRIRDQLPEDGEMARLGGDEFTIIIDKINDEEDVVNVADSIEACMAAPFIIDNTRLKLGASIGAAVYPTDTNNLTDLLSFADTAMYEAKLGIAGLPKHKRYKRSNSNRYTTTDLVNRQFNRDQPDQLWMTDIERHEALCNLAVVKGHRSWLVAAG